MKTAVGCVIFEGAEKYLRDFFLSLEMQTDQDFSIIIINDNISSEHLDQIIRQVSPNIKERLSIVDRTQSKLNPATLRVELLREAFYKDIELVIMVDCDDKASSNRVCCVKEQLDPAYTFFYNELLDFNGNSIMKELPDYTLNYRDIGQSNYLGISNGAIFLKGISQAFIESLGEVETRIFDWYLYSRLLLNEKKGKKINGCYTYYRIYEANLAGKCEWSRQAVKKEIEIKREHYRLLTPYDNYYKNLLQVYSSTCTEQFTEQFADQEMTGYWWSLTNIQLEEER